MRYTAGCGVPEPGLGIRSRVPGWVPRAENRREPQAAGGAPGMALRSEVEVLSWSPDRGNPTSRRQGRGPEFTGRPAGGRFETVCWRGSVRACLEEAVDALSLRTRVKRRKAFPGWVSWPSAAMPDSCWSRGRSGDVIAAKSQRLTLGGLLGSGRFWPVGRRTRGRRLDGPAEVGGPRSTGRRGNAR